MEAVEAANNAVMSDFCSKFVQRSCSRLEMLALIETRGYSAMASCVIMHIITNIELKESERLYYVLADLYANYNRAKRSSRSATIPGVSWAQRLGLREEYVFVLQKSLEEKGYFSIQRNKCDNQNEINVISPTIPDDVYEILKQEPSKQNINTSTSKDCQRSYLDDTKMFIKFNNKQIESIMSNKSLSPLQKIIWLFLYIRSNLSYQKSGEWSAPLTQNELVQIFKCNQSTASKALNKLEELGFIAKSQYKTHANNLSNRRKKSIWFIEALFPYEDIQNLLKQKARANINLKDDYYHELNQIVDNIVDNKNDIPSVKADYSPRKAENSLRSAHFSQNAVSSNKDLTSNSFCNKNINHQILKSDDVIDVNLNKNHERQAPVAQTSKKYNLGLFDLDIAHEKYQRNLQKLTKEQAKKAINYAKKLINDASCSEFLTGISQDELIRQFIHHTANFKPTKIYCETRNEEVDAALSFAYTAVKKGRWRCPSGWGDAIDLHLEKEKYNYEHNDSKQVEQFAVKVGRYLRA